MDLAEKRRQLEEIRAAREAKQRSVQQKQQKQQGTAPSATVVSTSSGSSMLSSVGGDPLRRAISTASVGSVREEQSHAETKTSLAAAAVRRRLTSLPTRASAGDVQLRGKRHDGGANTEARKNEESGLRKVEVGLAQVEVKPCEGVGETKSEKELYNHSDDVVNTSVSGTVGSSVATGGAVNASASDRGGVQDNDVSGRRRVTITPDVALLLMHSLKAESCYSCNDRCVLDVVMLESTLLQGGISLNSADNADNNNSDDDSGSCSNFLIAATLSESFQADDKKDNTPQTTSGRGGGDGLLLMQISSPSPSLSSSAAVAESVGAMPGLVLLWCISSGKTNNASYTILPLCFESEIRILTYTRHCPDLLFGGSANGRVVAWSISNALQGLSVPVMATVADSLLKTPLSQSSLTLMPRVSFTPVRPSEESFPSPQTHQSRILGMSVHGDVNYHHLYTISQDGRVCMWAPQLLRLPTSCRDCVVSGLPPSCIGSCAAFVNKAADAMSKVVVGCLDGHVLEGRTKSSRTVEMIPINTTTATTTSAPTILSSQDKPSSDTRCMTLHRLSTLSTAEEGPAHNAAIIAVAPYPLHADPRLSATVLTAAADGTCSLWLGSRHVSIDGFASQVSCLQWSPTHPTVFVAGESNGRVSAWDLSRNLYSPVAFIYLRPVSVTPGWAQKSSLTNAGNMASYRCAAVTALSFSDDGAWLSCGNSSGEVHLLRLRAELVMEIVTGTGAKAAWGNSALSAELGDAAAIKNDNGDVAAAAAPAEKYSSSSWIDARFAL